MADSMSFYNNDKYFDSDGNKVFWVVPIESDSDMEKFLLKQSKKKSMAPAEYIILLIEAQMLRCKIEDICSLQKEDE